MDNDDKVKDLIVRSKDLFLKDIQKEMERSELYNLDEEFAKTKKNRSPMVWLSIILFVAVFVGIAVLVNLYVQRESRNIAVNIEAFEDVNLREVLDKAKQYDRELMEARRRLNDLVRDMEKELDQLNAEVQRQIDVIKTRNMSSSARNREIAALNAKLETDSAAVRDKYQPAINEVEREIAVIEEKIAAYDSRALAMAKEQEEVLNNQQRLFEIQQQETVKYYEAQIADLEQQLSDDQTAFNEYKENLMQALEDNHQEEVDSIILTYNPKFKDPEIIAILKDEIEEYDESTIPFGYRDILAGDGIYTQEELAAQYERIKNLKIIVDRLQAVPYINSVPDATAYLEYTMYLVVKDYEELWKALADDVSDKARTLRARNKVIDQFTFALNSLISSSRENGYILDSRNPNDLVVFIGDLYEVNDGDTGYVFREDDEFIALIRFTHKDGRVSARMESQADPEKAIMPFDKILIETN